MFSQGSLTNSALSMNSGFSRLLTLLDLRDGFLRDKVGTAHRSKHLEARDPVKSALFKIKRAFSLQN